MPKEETPEEGAPAKSNVKLYGLAGMVVALLIGGGLMMVKRGDAPPPVELEKPAAEYVVPSKMYQLKDGSYLKLGFSIVIDGDKLPKVKEILEKESPGRLPSGLNMVLGAKTRDDLIAGTTKREAFAKLLKKMLEERIFSEYNKKQSTSRDTVEIREVLISEFVTQSGG